MPERIVDTVYDCGCRAGYRPGHGVFAEPCDEHRRAEPPMPVGFQLFGTVRNDQPVARVTFVDVLSEQREMDFDEDTAMDLVQELITFIGQIRVRRYHPSLDRDQ